MGVVMLGDIRCVFCVRNGSGCAEKWTSVSPCLGHPDDRLELVGRQPETRAHAAQQGLTLVHVRAQLEQLQDTFMNYFGLYGGQRSSS